MKTLSKLSAAALCAVLLLSGCTAVTPGGMLSSTLSDPLTAASQAESTPAEDSQSEPQSQGSHNPLTGENTLAASAVGKRPVAIMVSNIKKSLPQYGISRADICYEVLAEGGITRIMALFADAGNIPTVGPVRSVRDYYVDLAAPYDALFVHFGGSPKGYDVIENRGIDDIDGITQENAFMQDTALAAQKGREHSFFVTASTLQKGISQKGYSTSGQAEDAFQFAPSADGATKGDLDAKTITVPYSGYCTASFSYDASSGKYLKSQFGQAHMDGGNGQQVAVKNVIVIETACTPIAGDDSGRIQVNLSYGSGYYAAGGKAAKISWKKGSYQNPLVLTGPDGSEISVAPGNTWVCVVNEGNDVSFS